MDVTEWEYKEFPGAPHEKACLDGVDFWHAHSGDMLLDDLVRGIQEIAVRDLRASLTRVEEERDEAYEDAAGIAEEGAYYGGNRTDAEGLARDIASAIRHKGRDLKAQDDARLSRPISAEGK